MTESEFWTILAKVTWDHTQGEEFAEIINGMINMLDSTDGDDYFGTEGWRRDFGWEN